MKRARLIALLAAVAVALTVSYCWPEDDKTLSEAVVGTWVATDTSNPAFHKRAKGVDLEKLVLDADGNLTYILESKSDPAASKTEPWGWKITKGRILVQFRGEGAADEWLGPLKFSVSRSKLTVYRKGYPPKEFSRVKG
jgi:hypothetical protein